MNKRINKFIITVLFILLSVFLVPGSVNAEEGTEKETENKEAYTGIAQIFYGYMMEDGSFDAWSTSIAVIVNNSTLITTDITAADYTETLESRKEGYKTLGINIKEVPDNLTIVVYKEGNSYIPVTEIIKAPRINKASETDSEETENLLILKTDNKFTDYTSFSPKSKINDEELFATGFSTVNMDGNHYLNADNILLQKIKVISEEENLRFSIDSEEYFNGSAIINGYNELYGLIIKTKDGGEAVPLKELEQILNDNNIIFDTAKEITPVDYTKIENAMSAANQIDIKSEEVVYTDESKAEFIEALRNANHVRTNNNSTQYDLDKAADDLDDARENLEIVPDNRFHTLITVLAIVAGVLLFGVSVAFIYLKNKDDINKLLGINKPAPVNTNINNNYIGNDTLIEGLDDMLEEEEEGVPMVNPVDMQRPIQQPSTPKNPILPKPTGPIQPNTQNPLKYVAAQPQKQNQFDGHNVQGGYIYEDRQSAPKNLDEASPSQSALMNDLVSNNEIIGTPYIIRAATGERLLITHNQYSVGRDTNVDYRIPENILISKLHCRFIEATGQWYIVDNNSSNGTLVNGIRIEPNVSVPIYDMTDIILANEKFVFRYIKEMQQVPKIDTQNVENTGILSNAPTPQQPAPVNNGYQTNPQPDLLGAAAEEDDDIGTNVLDAYSKPDNLKVPYLIIKNKKIKMDKMPFSVGRGKSASYKYTNDPKVSRQHIIITHEDGEYYVKDNNSSNGTLLNNEPMDANDEYKIKNGDRLKIIDEVIEFHV